jgi:serine/threonine-protein kinase
LAEAHAHGLVHRDLKPQNIMIAADGRPKLLDFGIAHSTVSPDAVSEIATHTATISWSAGAIVGTPAYMSPEQVLCKPVDGRSDLFALGAVLFECLTGHPAFQAGSDVDTWARVVYVTPPAPSSINSQVPVAVDAVLANFLAKDPAGRYATAGASAEALRGLLPASGRLRKEPLARPRTGLAAAAVLVMAALVAALVFTLRPRLPGEHAPAQANSPLPVLAVLPLSNLSGDPQMEYIGAGMAETMSTKLASLPGLVVVSRSEVHDAVQRVKDEPKLYRALGLTYAVTGAVQAASGRLRITINLVGPDGRTVVAQGGRIYEDSEDRLFELQQHIAEDLTTEIVGQISAADRAQLARRPTGSVAAMSAYWRGRALMERPGPDPIAPAIDAFNEAIALDGNFTLAYAALGAAYWRKYANTREPSLASKAVDATERARKLDPDQAEVRLALATVYNGLGRTGDAVAEAQRALQLQPSSYEAHRLLGEIRAKRGEFDLAIGECLAAVRIRADYPSGYRSLGLMQMLAGRYADAAVSFERMATLDPDSPYAYQLLGNAHLSSGQFEAAERDFAQALAHGGSFATHTSLGFVYYIRGRFDDASKEFLAAIALRPNNATTYWSLGDTYRQLGRTAEARAAYARAVQRFDADLRVDADDAGTIATRATCLARLGQSEQASREIERAVKLQPGNQDVQYQRALVALILRRPAQAVAALEEAVAAGYSVPLLRVDRDLAALAADPRFQTLVGKVEAPARRNK